MSLQEGWLKRKGFWKSEYEDFTEEKIKRIAYDIQLKRDREQHIINMTKFYLNT